MDYTLYVDESGQSGIKRIRAEGEAGASPYITLGAALVPNVYRDEIRARLFDLAQKFGKDDLHCSRLNHNQMVKFAQLVSDLRVLLFGVISYKSTLGSYRQDIKSDHGKYYNKCSQYLLERVGYFASKQGLNQSNLSICFEEGNFDYSGLRGLIGMCRRNPLRGASRYLENISPSSILAKPKAEDSLLQLGDLVAHALFKCVDRSESNYGVLEPRYVREMKGKFFADEESGKICGYGIYPVHKLSHIELDPEMAEFFQELGKH